MQSKRAATLYGFIELDTIFDSTQSFNDQAANTVIARPDSYAAEHRRFMMGARNSRIGFKLLAPEFEGLKASATLEMDFLGNQPGSPPAFSEASFFHVSRAPRSLLSVLSFAHPHGYHRA